MESTFTKNFFEESKKSFEMEGVRITGARIREILLYYKKFLCLIYSFIFGVLRNLNRKITLLFSVLDV